MDKKLIELTDERGIEFYLVPHIGRRKIRKDETEFIYVKTYLNTIMKSTGHISERVGLNADIETMSYFLATVIKEFNNNFSSTVDFDDYIEQ